MENSLNRLAPENDQLYTHTLEGPDDMPAHIKTALLGVSINIPITNGNLNLGTWQGIWLCEHRDSGGTIFVILILLGARNIVVTLQGQT